MLLSRDLSLIALGKRALPQSNQILVQVFFMDFNLLISSPPSQLMSTITT